jgi:hypothetical protein
MRRQRASTHGRSFQESTNIDVPRLVEPFQHLALSSKPITPTTPVAGFEDAGMGKIVELREGLGIGEIVKMVKKHLSLEYGASESTITS